MALDQRPVPRSVGIVVGIGGRGLEACRTAVRLGAEEATLRQVPLRLVHGSRPAGRDVAVPTSAAGMEYRQQRGRRLVNGAARDLARTPLGRGLQILTDSSPRTGVDLLLAYGLAAVMLVLQRGGVSDLPAGRTTRTVIATAACPTLVTRSGDQPAGAVGVLVLVGPERDPAPAIALGFAEAALRGIAVTVIDGRIDGRSDGADARSAVRVAALGHPHVAVRYAAVDPGRTAELIKEVALQAAIMVVVRPARAEPGGLVADAALAVACPVLMVAPHGDG